jgi:hypothetical protein
MSQRVASGFLPTYDIVGKTYDIVIYDVDIRYRLYPTHDVAIYNIVCFNRDRMS